MATPEQINVLSKYVFAREQAETYLKQFGLTEKADVLNFKVWKLALVHLSLAKIFTEEGREDAYLYREQAEKYARLEREMALALKYFIDCLPDTCFIASFTLIAF